MLGWLALIVSISVLVSLLNPMVRAHQWGEPWTRCVCSVLHLFVVEIEAIEFFQLSTTIGCGVCDGLVWFGAHTPINP